MEIVRERLYEMIGSGETVIIKKWSAHKFLFLVSTLAEMIDKAVSQMTQNGAAFTLEMLVAKVILNAVRSNKIVTRIVLESVEDPKLEGEFLKEWDMEDLMGVLYEIADLNVTEDVKKKAWKIIKRVLPQVNLEQSLETPSGSLN